MSNQLMMAGLPKLLWKFAEQRGIPRSELVRASGLDAAQLADPDTFIPQTACMALFRVLLERTGDPALGLELARGYELKTMGFYGYALASTLTLRQRIQMHQIYSRLHAPMVRASLRIEHDRCIGDWEIDGVPEDLLPIIVDFSAATSARQLAKHLGCARPDAELWFTYPEQPHHREFRSLVSGPLLFNAPNLRFSIAAKELDRRLPGDVHLFELTKRLLDEKLAKFNASLTDNLLAQVRTLLSTNLASDASLERIAADLQTSPRTLRRHLHELGASFQTLLEETRRSRATTYLTNTNHAIKQVAAQVGYRDPSNFRRAFRRWTGQAPEQYRSTQRNRAT